MISPDDARKAMRAGERNRKQIEKDIEQARLKTIEQNRRHTRNTRLPQALKEIEAAVLTAATGGETAYTFEDSDEYLINLLMDSLQGSGFTLGRDRRWVPERRGNYDEQSWDDHWIYQISLQWRGK